MQLSGGSLSKIALTVFLIVGSPTSFADPISFSFSGSIPLDGGEDPRGAGGGCGGANSLCGNDVHGFLTIDDEPNSTGFYTTYGGYGDPYGMVLFANGVRSQFDGLIFRIANDVDSGIGTCPPCDVFWMEAFSSPNPNPANFFQGVFFDQTGTAISDSSLLPDAGAFNSGCTAAITGCTLDLGDSRTSWCCEFNWQFERTDQVIVISEVPEPEIITLLVFGLLILALFRRIRWGIKHL